jgi:hypothetical protein
MTFWRRAQSDECFFLLLIPGLTLVSVLEANQGLKLSRNSRTPENDHFHIYMIYASSYHTFNPENFGKNAVKVSWNFQ